MHVMVGAAATDSEKEKDASASTKMAIAGAVSIVVPPTKDDVRLPGINWIGNRRAWRARIRIGKDRVHLGYFQTKEEASRVYEKKRAELEKLNQHMVAGLKRERDQDDEEEETISSVSGSDSLGESPRSTAVTPSNKRLQVNDTFSPKGSFFQSPMMLTEKSYEAPTSILEKKIAQPPKPNVRNEQLQQPAFDNTGVLIGNMLFEVKSDPFDQFIHQSNENFKKLMEGFHIQIQQLMIKRHLRKIHGYQNFSR